MIRACSCAGVSRLYCNPDKNNRHRSRCARSPAFHRVPHAQSRPRHPRLANSYGRTAFYAALLIGALAVAGVLVWQGFTAAGNPVPDAPNTSAAVAVLDIGVLTFREGLECVLVLSAITASMTGSAETFRRPIAWGAGVAFLATIATWFAVIGGILGALSENVSALHIQAATGLLAIIVLLIVMNWFFHKIYWTGWIGLHTRKKQGLVKSAADPETSRSRVFIGLALLGFTSLYREGFEVVLFLQSYRLRLGSAVVLDGVTIGLLLTSVVAVLAFVAHQRVALYKKMLVFTGVMLGAVLLVMALARKPRRCSSRIGFRPPRFTRSRSCFRDGRASGSQCS